MAIVALITFVTAASLGLLMAVLHVRGKESGTALGLAHGLFALSGIALLAVGIGQIGEGQTGAGAWWLVGLFLLTATGGAYLFYRQRKNEPWPGAVIALHGAAALLSIGVLAVWVAGRASELEPVQPTPAEQFQNDVNATQGTPSQRP